MKKMWKKNNKAVSPVIATILMVAITVVLAAVLYVMVMGFGGSGNPQAPAVTLTKTTIGGGQSIVISIDRQVPINQIGVSIGGATAVLISAGTNGGSPAVTWTFTPLNAGKVSTSDRIVITASNGQTLQLVWTASNTITGATDLQNVGNSVTL
jgi:archaeal type IV pilus assembly protein PilA